VAALPEAVKEGQAPSEITLGITGRVARLTAPDFVAPILVSSQFFTS
jgi:hypothetical protein